MIATMAVIFQRSYGNRALGYLAKIKMTTEPASTEDPSHATSTEISRPSAPAKAYKRVSMGWWPLRLSAKILALLRLSVNFFSYG